jgi:nucleotide-binding universal stress UspA family protein
MRKFYRHSIPAGVTLYPYPGARARTTTEVSMIALKTVLCPVDFSPATQRQVDLAAELCRAFGAKLVLHHNLHSLGTGASVGWMWKVDHHGDGPASRQARLDEYRSRLPEGIASEGLITEGPVSRTVLAVSESLKVDLVVLTAHATHSDQHQSITERVLEEGNRAVLVLHETAVEPRTLHFTSAGGERQIVIVPTDLRADSRAALELGLELARLLPIELHLLHVIANGILHRASEPSDEDVRRKMRAMLPEDLADRTQLHVEHGDPSQGIARAVDQLSASCVVMGEHQRKSMKSWFSRGTSHAVLRQAHCPVWYVPGQRDPIN